MTQEFDVLPIEIIQCILDNGPCSNALVLARVNSRLRAVCTDPKVYTSIIQNRQGMKSFEPLGDSQWWDNVNLHSETDWQTCARWALADMLALDHLDPTQNAKTPDSKDFWVWLPELLASGHPTAASICPSISDSLDAQNQLGEIPLLMAQLSQESQVHKNNWIARVILVLASSLFGETEIMRHEGISFALRGHEAHAQLNSYFANRVARFLDTEIDVLAVEAEGNNGIWGTIDLLMNINNTATMHHWTQCMELCIIMTPILHRQLTVTPVQTTNVSNNWSIATRPPPGICDIPWQAIYGKIAPPYTLNYKSKVKSQPTCDFANAHLAHMTSKAFLEDGEWIGYYCYTTTKQPTWDPIMSEIKFKVTSECPDHCTVQGSGRDLIAPFSLNGTIFRTTGWAQLAKGYQPGRHSTWSWSTMMTPFGIVGCWGTQNWGGWVWLWKKAWTVKS